MRKLLFSVFVLALEICQGQQLPDYCVYLVKGKVTFSKQGSAKSVPVKQNQFLYKNEDLTLSKNSEITLINNDDRLLVLNEGGSFKVNDLEKKFNYTLSSVTKSYAHLVYHELLDPDYNYSSFRQNNLGGVRGGVSRGEDCDNLIFPVKDLKTDEDSILFKWHSNGTPGEYNLIIYDSLAKEIVSNKVKDTQQIISVNKALKGNTGKYYWVVKGNGTSCESDPIPFEIRSKEDGQKLIPALEIKKGNKDILSRLQIVDELEKDKWIYTAMKYYASIVQNNPGNVPLVKSYVLFLLKYGFDDKAAAAWKEIKN